jgi:vacuolar-type H+-ATPase subunit B/Vma2
MARITAYERYSDGQTTRDIFLIERDKLAAETQQLTDEKAKLEQELMSLSQTQDSELTAMADTARTYLKADELTNRMALCFIDRIDVYSGMRLHIH